MAVHAVHRPSSRLLFVVGAASDRCDAVSMSLMLRCIGNLLRGTGFLPGMADSKIATLRNYSDHLCSSYLNYKLCASEDLLTRCHDIGRVAQSLYDYVCSPDVRKHLQTHSACLKHMDQDPSVLFCELTIKGKLEKLYAMKPEEHQAKAKQLCDMIEKYDKCASTAYLSKCGSKAWEIKFEFVKRSVALDPNMNCRNLVAPKPTQAISKNIDVDTGASTSVRRRHSFGSQAETSLGTNFSSSSSSCAGHVTSANLTCHLTRNRSVRPITPLPLIHSSDAAVVVNGHHMGRVVD
ncbi:unnamed protein product [Soboliphyme baturini]|uniref:DUF19 domain-containing protein n=1 Tax=Soboliphyme baturini TaxID=241478 RepID=A0A183ICU7_9BILA|nr:unnamed protein product [Soboliphyme baturini]